MKSIATLHKDIVRALLPMSLPEEARAMAYALLAYFTKCTRTQLHAFSDTEIPDALIAPIQAAVQRLLRHEPLQYIIGETVFCGLPIAVNPHVLIPRPETEELVGWAVEELTKTTRPVVVDLCTGSGCVAIALKNALPTAVVHACDVSDEALETARCNAANNHAAIHFFVQDVCSDFSFAEKVDCVISNPPYVRHSEKTLMQANVLMYEPHVALCVDDEDPMLFYRAITRFATQHLQPGGLVLVEINEMLGKETMAVFEIAGCSSVALRKDMKGKNRMLKAVFPGMVRHNRAAAH